MDSLPDKRLGCRMRKSVLEEKVLADMEWMVLRVVLEFL